MLFLTLKFHDLHYVMSVNDAEKKVLVKLLREETGWDLMLCKRALNESNWNIDEAKSWLIQFRKKPGIRFN